MGVLGNVRVYALLYGDYPLLHRRLLGSLERFSNSVDIRLWCNTLGPASRKIVDACGRSIRVYHSSENVPKYKVMRELFSECKGPEHSPSDWVVWFDDDAHIVSNDWLIRMESYIQSHPEAVYVGQPWFVHHLPGQWDFIKASPWFKGREPEMVPASAKRVPGVTFAQGSYWWLRGDVLRNLDWPDVRLSHNGGDTLLGEAIRQAGLPFHKYCYGVKLNDAPRRGLRERPAGSTVDARR